MRTGPKDAHVRVVADTNVLISGLLWRGAPATFLDRAISRAFLLSGSEELLDELSKDLPVLRCAVAAKAHAIVSGDQHLLDLNAFRGIPIVTPRVSARSRRKRNATRVATSGTLHGTRSRVETAS